MYYSDGGPGPATKLLRLDVIDVWRYSPGWTWGPAGWIAESGATAMILGTGEFSQIDPADVPRVQEEIAALYA
jgi:hypothetical protein